MVAGNFNGIFTKLNVNMKNNSHDDYYDDKLNHVIIKGQKLIQGRLDSKIYEYGQELIHIIYNDYNLGSKILDDLQNIVAKFLVLTSFSDGIDDLVAGGEKMKKLKVLLLNQKSKCKIKPTSTSKNF